MERRGRSAATATIETSRRLAPECVARRQATTVAVARATRRACDRSNSGKLANHSLAILSAKKKKRDGKLRYRKTASEIAKNASLTRATL